MECLCDNVFKKEHNRSAFQNYGNMVLHYVQYSNFQQPKKIRKGNSSLFAHDFQNLEIKQEQQSYKTNEEENIL